MEKEKDLEYSEIMELATLHPNKVPQPPKSPAEEETRFGTYVNVADIFKQKTELGTEPSASSKLSPSDTFKRYSSIEETDVVLYDDVVLPAVPIRETMEKMASTDQILAVNLDVPVEKGVYSVQEDEDVLSLKTRLRIKKRMFNFLEFASYAMVAVYKEVEKIACINVVLFIVSVLVTSLGCTRLVSCRVSPQIPVLMVVSGSLDAVSDIFSLVANCARNQNLEECFRDVARIVRMLMFFVHLYCMIVVYRNYTPEGKDRNSPNYCDPLTFWAAYSYFHFTFGFSVFLGIGMLSAAVCYFL